MAKQFFGVGKKSFVDMALSLSISVPLFAAAATVTQVSSGGLSYSYTHSAAVLSDGSLWMWGSNEYGQLGNGTTTDAPAPIKVMSNVSRVEASEHHTFAITTDGGLWAWGRNLHGQLGNGFKSGTGKISTPILIGSGFVQVAASGSHTVALKADGGIWAWGSNECGKYGGSLPAPNMFSYGESYSPVKFGSGFRQVAAGGSNTAAITQNGELIVWGCNSNGELGNGKQPLVSPLDYVSLGKGYQQVAVGDRFMVALKSDGSLWGWGSGWGVMGYGSVPQLIGTGFSSVSAKYMNASAVKPDGSLWTWGDNGSGQLGVGSFENSSNPLRVGDGYVDASVAKHALAIKVDGQLWSWGLNNGALGYKMPTNFLGQSISPTNIPRLVADLPYSAPSNDRPPVVLLHSIGAQTVSVSSSGSQSYTTNSSINAARVTTAAKTMTLTAPLTHNGALFSHWTGCDGTSGGATSNVCTVQFTKNPATTCASTARTLCDGDKRVAAVYTNAASRLVNISTRAKVLTGDNVLIAGFIVTGGPKRLLIKGIGPSMAAAGVTGAMADPTIKLYSFSTVLHANDDWQMSANANEISSTGLAPNSPREAALLVTLEPGAYTVILEGMNQTTGVAMVSVDDLDNASSAGRLSNISSRAWASTGGEDQMIAGFVIAGGSKRVLVTGTGPNMSRFNVPGLMTDPAISLYSGATVLENNGDWGAGSSAVIDDIAIQAGSFLTSSEAGIQRELSPGAYTVIMRGAQGSGIGLVAVEE